MVGIDTIIAVPSTHPPHPHTNSTATKQNDPMGLKFCMRPHLTILTTTKHNLILLFSDLSHPSNSVYKYVAVVDNV